MLPLGSVVDWDAIGKVVIAAFVAGIGVTVVFATAIYGATRFADMRRDGRSGEALALGVFTALALAACAGAVVLGIVVMTQK
jgi:uncharacterized membrane protein YidH (DUF202 family)